MGGEPVHEELGEPKVMSGGGPMCMELEGWGEVGYDALDAGGGADDG